MWSITMTSWGLSPRVRGNPPKPVASTWGSRSIPACAGEPRWMRPRRKKKRVYPRVCGGTERMRIRNIAGTGLSPRVRGNPHGAVFPLMFSRSIPACAGEPSQSRCS